MSNPNMIEEIRSAIGAHGAWKLKLRTAITLGRCEESPAQVRCDDRCRLGQWLYGPELDARVRNGKPYQVVRRLHTEFHDCAARVLTLALQNQKSEAEALLEGEYTAKSEILVVALTKWRGEAEQDLRNAA